MKREIYEIAGDKAFKSHCKIEALRELMENARRDLISDRGDSAKAGLVYILEDISNEVRAVYQMLDVQKAEDLSVEANDPCEYVKGYPLHGFERNDKKTEKFN